VQAIVILGIFGLFYATVVSLTVLLSQSSIQKKLESIDTVRQIFNDFEFAVNKGYLAEQPDLDPVLGDGNMLFVRRYVRWSADELTSDPWGMPYTVLDAEETKLLYADAGVDDNVVDTADNNAVEAPVVAYALISNGPDRQLQTDLTGVDTHTEILSLEESDANDDIIHTFTTYARMAEMWDEVRSTADKIVAIAKEDYKKQYEVFLPEIVQYYDANGITLIDISGTIVDQAVVDSWKTDGDTLTNFLRANNAACSPCFPEMANDVEALGVDEELKQLPTIVSDVFDISQTVGVHDVIDFTLDESGVSSWGISYTVRIEGDDAIQ